jgi:hypothetical protein
LMLFYIPEKPGLVVELRLDLVSSGGTP